MGCPVSESDFDRIYLSDVESHEESLADGSSTSLQLSNDMSMVGKTYLVGAEIDFQTLENCTFRKSESS